MATSAAQASLGKTTSSQYRGTVRARSTVVFLAVTLVLWVVVVTWAKAMGTMPGTMGLGIAEFMLMWVLMMSAMMLPSVAPMTLLYSRTLTRYKRFRQGQFALGYLTAWGVVGLAAFSIAAVAGRLTADTPTGARITAVATFAVVGVYQLTPWKFRCLEHCRSPLGHLMHYASFRGTLRHFNAGLHHGLFCLGCCWALMVLLVVFGVMNVWAMVGLALIVATEKLWRHGKVVARCAGYASIALAVAVIFWPKIAPGLNPSNVMDTVQMGTMGG